MSQSSTPPSIRPKKVLVPKVWKRPHSTIYGKNVEFGSSLYSDKIGELNGRKFNSELPWTMRNSGGSSTYGATSNQSGYLSLANYYTLVAHNDRPHSASQLALINPNGPVSSQALLSGLDEYDLAGCQQHHHHHLLGRDNYTNLLELTNPSRFSKRRLAARNAAYTGNKRIDFYDKFGQTFYQEMNHLRDSSLMASAPIMIRKVYDNNLNFDQDLGLFVPHYQHGFTSDASGIAGAGHHQQQQASSNRNHHATDYINTFVPTTSYKPNDPNVSQIVPLHTCHLSTSPYGQSADGRKLSLGSINPHSYRPSLPQKTTTAHSSEGEEFEFQDRSSPFYTDRWAGKTIRHFDSDLYSNANLFKSMIL